MIAVIGGTGHLGLGLAMRWSAARVPVVIGSRSLERAQEAAAKVRAGTGGGPAEGRENAAAAREAEVIVITVPASAHAETLSAIAEAAAGKVVVDTTVQVGRMPASAAPPGEGSAAERAQRFFGDRSRIVAAFHTVPASLLADLSRPVDCDVLVCGDNESAKARIIGLAQTFGARGVDVGALRHALTLERLTVLLISAGRRMKRHELGVRITGL